MYGIQLQSAATYPRDGQYESRYQQRDEESPETGEGELSADEYTEKAEQVEDRPELIRDLGQSHRRYPHGRHRAEEVTELQYGVVHHAHRVYRTVITRVVKLGKRITFTTK